MKNDRKVGIMGGTFNPIHNGHLMLARCAQEQIGLDKVLFMPSGNSYMKKNVLEPQKEWTWYGWRFRASRILSCP